MSLDNYNFHRVDRYNIGDVVRLVNKIAKQSKSINHYWLKYKISSTSDSDLGWLAYEKFSGLPVSVALSIKYQVAHSLYQTLPIVQLTETFTLPEHRGKGLMTTLMKMILDHYTNQNIKMFFGFLKQEDIYGFLNKLHFSFLTNMKYFRIPVNTFPLEAICRKLGLSGITKWWINRVLKKYGGLSIHQIPNSSILSGHWGIEHDDAFFSYKSFSYNRFCKFMSITSWLKLESGLLVGDIYDETTSKDQFISWFHELKKLAYWAGLKQIIFQVHPSSDLYTKLSSVWTPSDSWTICYYTSDDNLKPILEDIQFCYGDVDTF